MLRRSLSADSIPSTKLESTNVLPLVSKSLRVSATIPSTKLESTNVLPPVSNSPRVSDASESQNTHEINQIDDFRGKQPFNLYTYLQSLKQSTITSTDTKPSSHHKENYMSKYGSNEYSSRENSLPFFAFKPSSFGNTTSIFVPTSPARYLAAPRMIEDISTKSVVRKELRPTDPDDLRKLRSATTSTLTNKFSKIPTDDANEQILINYNLQMRVKSLRVICYVGCI